MTATSESMDRLPARLPSLTGYRVILFIAVFLTHALGAGFFFADQRINALGTILPYGTAALSIFFVLSGFVLTWQEPWRTKLGDFWRRRALKIFPGHVVTWAGTLLMLWAIGPTLMLGKLPENPGPALANLFLIQGWFPNQDYLFSVYGVNWSVSCEIAFYLALPLLIRPILRIRPDRLWAWFGGVAALIIAIPIVTYLFVGGPVWDQQTGLSFAQVYLTNFFPLSRMTEFLLGVLLARVVQTGRWPRWMNFWWVGLLSAVLCALVLYVLPPTFRISGLLTLGLCLLVPLVAIRDIEGRSRWFNRKPVVILGDATYATYLVHFPLLGLLRYLVGEETTFGWLAGTLLVLGLFVVTILVGLFLYRYVERPLMRRFSTPSSHWRSSGRERGAADKELDKEPAPSAPGSERTP